MKEEKNREKICSSSFVAFFPLINVPHLVEHIFHSLKKTLVALIGTGVKILATAQFFQDFLFFFVHLFWCPNIDVYEEVSSAIPLQNRQTFSFQTEHFSTLCPRFNFNFRLARNCWYFNGFTQDSVHEIDIRVVVQVFTVAS